MSLVLVVGEAAASPLDRVHHVTPDGMKPGSDPVTIYVFWSYSCPQCHELSRIFTQTRGIEWRVVPVGQSDTSQVFAEKTVGAEGTLTNRWAARELEVRGTPTSFIVDDGDIYRVVGNQGAAFWESAVRRVAGR